MLLCRRHCRPCQPWWETDSCDSVARIDGRVWPGVHLHRSHPHDPLCGGLSRSADCCVTGTTIELGTFPSSPPRQRTPCPRLLRRAVPHRALGRAHTSEENRRDAVSAHGPRQEAPASHRRRDWPAAGGATLAGCRLPRSLLPRSPRPHRCLQRGRSGKRHPARDRRRSAGTRPTPRPFPGPGRNPPTRHRGPGRGKRRQSSPSTNGAIQASRPFPPSTNGAIQASRLSPPNTNGAIQTSRLSPPNTNGAIQTSRLSPPNTNGAIQTSRPFPPSTNGAIQASPGHRPG